MPDLGKNFCGITVGLSGYPQGFANEHLGRTEPVAIDWNCYDPGSDFSARLLTGYDYGTPKVSSHISHGQLSQSAE